MKSMIFSKRLVFVYTAIVIIPFFILLMSFSGYLKNNYYEELIQNSERIVLEQVKEIESHIDTFAHIESVILTNNDLKFFFFNADDSDKDDSINMIISVAREIERI